MVTAAVTHNWGGMLQQTKHFPFSKIIFAKSWQGQQDTVAQRRAGPGHTSSSAAQLQSPHFGICQQHLNALHSSPLSQPKTLAMSSLGLQLHRQHSTCRIHKLLFVVTLQLFRNKQFCSHSSTVMTPAREGAVGTQGSLGKKAGWQVSLLRAVIKPPAD